jgi:hypothetical protein
LRVQGWSARQHKENGYGCDNPRHYASHLVRRPGWYGEEYRAGVYAKRGLGR